MKKPGIVLLLAIFVSLVFSTPALASASFSDVPTGSVFYDCVTRLAQRGIVSGFPDDSFHPYDFITRQQLAKMIVLATHTSIEDSTSTPTFSDLSPDLGRPYPYDYVVAMFRAGFFLPMGDTARPLYEMTRTHLAIVLVRAGDSHLQDPPAGYTGGYDDPPNFSADAVLKAKYNGLLDGVTPTRMEPFSLVTRGQACKAVARLVGKLDTVAGIHGLDAVPPGFALVVLGESREGSVVHHVRSLIIPELGIFQMELDGTVVAPAEMVLTVRTPEKQAGYRGQAVLEGDPRPMDMAFLDSPLTYPSDQWTVETSTATGNHVSATLGRGREPAVEERTVEADVDPQTGIIISEVQTRPYLSSTITRNLVPLSSQMTPDLASVRARARTDWQKTIAAAGSLGYPVLGLDLPTLQLHMLQFGEGGEGYVWLNYSAKDQPGRLAVRTWQLPSSEAEALPIRFPASWAASSSDTGEPGMVRTFFEGARAVQVFVYDWVVREDPGILEEVEGALLPLSETDQARDAEPPVLLFDGPMPLPSGANFGGLLSDTYRNNSG